MAMIGDIITDIHLYCLQVWNGNYSMFESYILQVEVRLEPKDKLYIETTVTISKERKEQVASNLVSTSIKRKFLLKLKAKYAGED